MMSKTPKSRAAVMAMIKAVREECRTDVEVLHFRLHTLDNLFMDKAYYDDGTIEAARQERQQKIRQERRQRRLQQKFQQEKH
jgi:hypothetical protein